jgi:hypothetical protein
LPGSERFCQDLISVPDRSEFTLLESISTHVNARSIIHTDLWRGYISLERDLRLRHLTVDHSEGFVSKSNGCHTNTIEGTWFGVKISIPIRNRVESRIDAHLLEFLWRRRNEDRLWEALVEALVEVAK